MSKRFIFTTFLFFLTTFVLIAQDNDGEQKKEPEVTVITINNARQSAYRKDEESGNDCIVLEGSVSVTVQKGNTTNEIKADKIVYDRKTEMLYADGNVEILMRSGSSGNDAATATSLIMNTSTLEGIFDNGRIVQKQSDALNLPAGSTLIVFSEIFGKGNENVITFKNSSLTFCDEDPPHWHIDATRTWLLPGGEFAFFNALLYVGVVPVLYFPAFYYPKDELIFNPVFNYEKRNGYSVQTTTYLWGRKPLDKSNNNSSSSNSSDSSQKDSTSAESLKAVYNFVKPSTLKEQVREGIVLHNLDEDFKGDSSHYVKLMADWYSNLGYMVGVDGILNPLPGYISRLDFNTYLGFSNTVFKGTGDELEYYPYSATGVTYKDESSFLGLKMPFRYALNFEIQLTKPFSFSLSFPVYSDPYFSGDFISNRQETMDWISYLLDNAKSTNDDKNKKEQTTTASEVSSFQWKSNSSFSPTIPSFMRPYLSSLSFSMSNSVSISSKNTVFEYEETKDGKKETVYTYNEKLFEKDWTTYTPMRRFYYPSMVTPVQTNVSASGTIFQWPFKKEGSSSSPSFVISLNKPDELKTEKELEEQKKREEEEAKKEAGETEEEAKEEEKAEEEKEEEKEDVFEYYLPDLDYSATKDTVNDGISYKLTYNVAMNLTTQMSYSDTNLRTSDDFDWNNVRSSMYNMKLPLSLASLFNYGGNFFTVENKFTFSPVFQDHPFISEDEEYGLSPIEIKKLKLSDIKSESRDVVNTNNVTLRPFVYYPTFSETNIAWNSSIRMYRRTYIGDADTPDWEEHYADWSDEESITVNSLSTDIRAKEFNNKLTQSLRLEMIMPPLKKKYTSTFTLGVPYASASVSAGFEEIRDKDYKKMSEKDKEKYKDEKWKKTPLNQSFSLTLFDSKFKFTESYTHNIEDDHPESLKLSASGLGIQLSYIQSYVLGYEFDPVKGWTLPKDKTDEDKEFLPYSLSLSYTLPGNNYYKWFNRVSYSLGLSTSIVADLLRPTNSYFLFTPSIKFKIHEFCDISFSASSRNSVLYWYFHNEEGDLYSDWGGFPGNVFKDLFDSFRFDDEEKRQNSGFKLKSLNLTVSHDLHDWKANMTMKIEPRIITENGKKMYDFKPYITIGVVWNPMESMKTTIIDDYGEWKLE